MAKIREETSAQSATFTLTTQGSARWMAPELLRPEQDAEIQFTKETDMWALGMTILVRPGC